MNSFKRIFWPALLVIGVVSFFSVYLISIFNPSYVVADRTNYLLFLVPVGVIGSLISIYQRYGLKRTRTLIITWSIALISVIALYTGDGLESLGWIIPIYISSIIGTIMIFVYSVRSAK
jgi:hypothetical protein